MQQEPGEFLVPRQEPLQLTWLSNKRPTSVSFPRSSRKEVLFTDSILIALRKSTGWGRLKPNGQGKGILKYKASFLRELFLVLFLQANSGFYLSGPR